MESTASAKDAVRHEPVSHCIPLARAEERPLRVLADARGGARRLLRVAVDLGVRVLQRALRQLLRTHEALRADADVRRRRRDVRDDRAEHRTPRGEIRTRLYPRV